MNREILRLAIPNIISNISVPLLSSVDTALMGHLTSAHLGAVGIGSMIFNFIYWNFGFLRMGTTGLTAQAFGAEDDHRMSHTLGRAVLVALILAVLILLFQDGLWLASAYLLNVDDSHYALVETYFRWRLIAAPATLAAYAIVGWFFGMQNAIYPLVLTIFVNVVNIATSAYLVIDLDWGIKGVAVGTVIAQYSGLLLAVGLVLYKYRSYVYSIRRRALLQWKALLAFLRVNSDIFIRTLCLTFVFGFMYSQASKSGALFLAANVILLQFLNWMSYGIDGFAFASESLVGKYVGAQNEGRLKKAILYCMLWGGVLAIGYGLFYGFFGMSILHLFTDQADVIAYTRPYLIWMVVMPIVGFACYIWDGVFVGLTAVRAMRNSMLLSLGVFLLAFYLLREASVFQQLWLSLLLFLFARGVIQSILYWRKGIALK